jgi:hypothetical protein
VLFYHGFKVLSIAKQKDFLNKNLHPNNCFLKEVAKRSEYAMQQNNVSFRYIAKLASPQKIARNYKTEWDG